MFFLENAKNSTLYHEVRDVFPALKPLMIFSCIIAFLSAVPTIFMIQVYERVMTSRNYYTFAVIFFIAVFLIYIWNMIEESRTKLLKRIAFAIDEKVGTKVFETTNRFPDIVPIQQSGLVMQDIAVLRDFIGSPIMTQILDCLFVPVILVVAFLLHPIYGLAVLAMTVLSAALSLVSQRAVRDDTIRQVHAMNRANDFGRVITANAEPTRVMGMLPRLIARWRGQQVEAQGWAWAAYDRASVYTNPLRLLRHLQMPILQAVGALLYLNEMAGGGLVVAGGILVMRALGPVDAVANSWRQIWNLRLSVERIDAVLKKYHARVERVDLPRPNGPLVVSRIAVVPRGREAPTLQDVSFTAMPGSVIGVVGPSGAGKSTLAKALVGAWPLARGSIQLDQHDISHWDPDQLGQYVGYVPQDIDLMPGTLAENIARFETITSENSSRLIEAVKGAGILDIVSKLPEGLSTRIGPEGAVLSGGQRQRVALARALYGDPRLVVMDEPNSNIDSAGEQLLVAAIARLREAGAIVLLITHRMNMLTYCDQVLVLNSGTVHAFGERDLILNRISGSRPATQQITDARADRTTGSGEAP